MFFAKVVYHLLLIMYIILHCFIMYLDVDAMPACACILMHIHTCIYIIYIRMQEINEHVAENSKWLTCMYVHNNNYSTYMQAQ